MACPYRLTTLFKHLRLLKLVTTQCFDVPDMGWRIGIYACWDKKGGWGSGEGAAYKLVVDPDGGFGAYEVEEYVVGVGGAGAVSKPVFVRVAGTVSFIARASGIEVVSDGERQVACVIILLHRHAAQRIVGNNFLAPCVKYIIELQLDAYAGCLLGLVVYLLLSTDV